MFHVPLLLFTLDNPEWLIILAIVVILFGGSKIGQVGGALGQSVREFKRAVRDDDDGKPETDARATTPPAQSGGTVTIVSAAPPAPAVPAPRLPANDYLPGHTTQPTPLIPVDSAHPQTSDLPGTERSA